MAYYEEEKVDFFHKANRTSKYIMAEAHFHPKHELYYLESGMTKYFIGNEIYILTPGDFIFVPKGTFHQTIGMDNKPVNRSLFAFDDNFVGSAYAKYITEFKKDKHIHISDNFTGIFKDIFDKIQQEDKNRMEGYKEMQKLYLRQILVLISRYKEKYDTVELDETHRIIQNAAKYISENYNSDLSLEALSRRYAISTGYFSKLFKKVTGVGLNDYITITRVTAAQSMLSDNKLSVTQVAEQCGFNDSNYFTQVFKGITGITPKKYQLSQKQGL